MPDPWGEDLPPVGTTRLGTTFRYVRAERIDVTTDQDKSKRYIDAHEIQLAQAEIARRVSDKLHNRMIELLDGNAVHNDQTAEDRSNAGVSQRLALDPQVIDESARAISRSAALDSLALGVRREQDRQAADAAAQSRSLRLHAASPASTSGISPSRVRSKCAAGRVAAYAQATYEVDKARAEIYRYARVTLIAITAILLIAAVQHFLSA